MAGFLQRHKKKLLAAQRQVLIRAIKAYATTLTACLPDIARVLPIDLYLERRIHLYRTKRNQPTILGELHLGADMYEDLDGSMVARNMVDAHLLQKWQTRWGTARTGRHTYEFFPNIRDDSSASGLGPPITSRSSSLAMVHSSSSCMPWD